MTTPQLSRKNSRSFDEECRESVIRFQIENESQTKSPVPSPTSVVVSSIKNEIEVVQQDVEKINIDGANKLGRLYFKVR